MVTRANDNETTCTYVGKNPCRHRPMEGATTCEHHGGNIQVKAAASAELNNYRLARFKKQHDIKALSESKHLKSLHEEIAITRVTLGSLLDSCEGEYDIALQAAPISTLITTIERTVKSCHQLELTSGELLSKNDLAVFAGEIIDIICQECDDATAGVIAERISSILK